MIQETYKLSVAGEGDCPEIRQRLGALLEKIGRSHAYQKASSVYAKLLTGNIPTEEAEKICRMVKEGLPKAEVAGMVMSLTPEEAEDVCLVASFCYFDEAKVSILSYDGEPERYLEAGQEIGHRIAQMEDVKAVEMFCIVLNTDLAPFVTGLAEENPEIPFFGSLAGMNHHFGKHDSHESVFDQESINVVISKCRKIECYIFGNRVLESGMAMAVFSGRDLHAQVDCLLGWNPLGKELTVTKSASAVCVETIDEIPAMEIYEKYLNVLPDERFLMNICEFPMILERNGFRIARTPPIFDADGRLYFIADIHEGEKFRLSYANPNELLARTRGASDKMWDFQPEGIFLIICPNRTALLKEDAPLEIEAYRRAQPQLIASHGPGEIYCYKGKGGVLNSTLVAAGLREGDCPCTAAAPTQYRGGGSIHKTIPLASRLAAFLNATTRELEESNQELKSMAEAARSASVAKSQFLSNMSHEIRTPINAILGMDEMILREATDETVLEYAENIRMAGSNLLGLINDILDFSKIESGKIDIIPVEYSLCSLLNDLVNMTQSRAEKKGLSFAVNTSSDLPSYLFGDEIRIKQIITNILTNAVKYTERGFVYLSVDYEKKEEDRILLKVSVKDSGIGIKEEDLEKLFTAFERIEEKRNRTIEGTGLGMNITRTLLSLMGTKLEIASIYGKGSTFSFALEQKVVNWEPMGDFDEAYHRSFAQRKKYSAKFTAPSAHVLVVDDTAMNLTVVQGLLKQTKVQIDTAKSGYECLELVAKRKYDIIFLDHRMPGLDGVETLGRMKILKGNKNQDTPVISLTANAVSGAREAYIAAGFKDYLTKPIDGLQLETTMLKYLPPEKLVDDTGEEEPEEISASREEESLPEWLVQVPGINTAEGLLYCGTAEIYLGALSIFAESIVPNAKEIAHYFEVEDWKNFTTKVHALKSTSRAIGAKELSERARLLEQAGNAGDIDTIKRTADDLLQLYLTYAFKLSLLCKPEKEEDEGKPMIDEAEMAEAYGTLREIASAFDYDNLMFVLQSLEDYRLPEADARRIQALRNASRKPDWDKVNDILKQ